MYVQLENSEEWVDDAMAGKLGEILIRCNNVLYICFSLATYYCVSESTLK